MQKSKERRERYLRVEPINVSLLDFYTNIATKQNISTDEVVNESGRLVDLLSSKSLPFDVSLQAMDECTKRFEYMDAFKHFAEGWLTDVLIGFRIPNIEQVLTVNIAHKARVFVSGLSEKQIGDEQNFKVVILPSNIDVSPEIEKSVYMKWNPTNPALTIGMPLLMMLWKAIGMVCLKRNYIDSEQFEEIFSWKAWEEASKRPYDYFNAQGRPLPNKDSGAWFIAPAFEFPKLEEPTEETEEEEEEREKER